jgi:hypothetical protein
MTEAQAHFAGWCRHLRGGYPREGWAKNYGLNGRSIQDLEQARSLPSRALVVLLKGIELNPEFMRFIAKQAGEELALLDDAQRGSRN